MPLKSMARNRSRFQSNPSSRQLAGPKTQLGSWRTKPLSLPCATLWETEKQGCRNPRLSPLVVFFFKVEGAHPFIVLSDPAANDKEVLIANLTSWNKDKDQTCIIEKGEHACIPKRSCVYYQGSMIVTLEQLCDGHRNGQILIRGQMDKPILERIWKSAVTADRLAPIKKKLLKSQGLG